MNPDAEGALASPGRRTAPASRATGRRVQIGDVAEDTADRVPMP